MNRTVNSILMLTYLQTGKVYKISEIANLLEQDTGEKINPRNIIEYRKELEYAGYIIVTIPGKNGGYRLDKNCLFPSLKLNFDEQSCLANAYEYLKNKNDFPYYNLLDKTFGKILSKVDSDNEESFIFGDFSIYAMSPEDINKRYHFFNDAIKERYKVEIMYENLKYGEQKHIVHPYKLFNYKNAWFILAFNPSVGNVWQFKLNRIKSYEKLNEHFVVWKGFNEKDYFSKNGFQNKNESYHLKLIVYGTALGKFKECIYGENQKISQLKGQYFTVELDMQNKNFIIDFILSFGDEIIVIEPKIIKDEILKKVNNLINEYSSKWK